MPDALAADPRRWRYRTDWRGRVILQVREQQTTTTAGASSPVTLQSTEWRDARVEDLSEWGGAA